MSTSAQLEAFEKYDFGSDDRWINYYNNLTIPPGRSDGIAITRRYKQKFFQKYVDPDFVVQSLEEASQAPSRPSNPNPGGQSSGSARSRAPNGPGPPPQGGRPESSPSSSGVRQQQQSPGRDRATFQFLANAFIIIMAVVAVFPLTPSAVAYRCFSLCLFGSFFSSALAVYHRYGRPTGFSWEAIKTWLQNVSAGREYLAIMHCGAFLPSPRPALLAVVPVACHLAPAVAQYLQQRVSRAAIYQSYLAKPCKWLIDNGTLVSLFAANMEISLGFLVIVFMFTPQRNFLLLFFYWQILKLEFQSPASAWYHRQVWAQLGAQVEPRIRQYAPFLLQPLGFAKQWFTRVPGAQ